MPFLLALLAAADFSLTAAGGSRGEGRAEALAHAASGDFALTLGAADFGGPQAPQRQEILLGAQAGVFKAEVRGVPPSAGLERLSAEAGVHFETVGLVLGARTASFGRAQLVGAGARIELEGQLTEDVRAGLSIAAWALQLDPPGWHTPWLRWGTSTLDWAQRWEAGAWASQDFFELFSLAPGLSFAQSAQPGVYEARASLAVEVPLGPVKLRAESAVARQLPELWLFDLTAAISVSLE